MVEARLLWIFLDFVFVPVGESSFACSKKAATTNLVILQRI
jgi:hypothetical protein